jgi:hypothetical protein
LLVQFVVVDAWSMELQLYVSSSYSRGACSAPPRRGLPASGSVLLCGRRRQATRRAVGSPPRWRCRMTAAVHYVRDRESVT